MLRPIPEDASDHGGSESMDSVSAAEAVASTEDGYEDEHNPDEDDADESQSVLSGVAAVLADPEGGGGAGAAEMQDGLLKKKKKRKKKKGEKRSSLLKKKKKEKLSEEDQLRQKRWREYKRKRRWARWRSFVVMGVVVVAAVTIVVVVVTTTGGDSGTAAGIVDTLSPTASPAPTVATVVDPETEAALDVLVDQVLVPISRYGASITATILESARTQAREWMLQRDLLRDEILADPTSVRFKQRFVLALLFYSLQIPDNNVNATTRIMMAEESECNWFGVVCDDTIVEQTATTTITVPVVRRVHWANLQADGVLPPELRDLQYLQELNVSFNALQSTLPLEWFETPPAKNGTVPELEKQHYLPYLYMLDICNNFFNGHVPHEFWLLPSLRFVYFTNNTLTGSLPSNDFFTSQEPPATPSNFLEDIWLGQNQLTGTMPTWPFELPILKSLIVQSNHLNGTLLPNPEAGIGLPDSLVVLDFSFNNFTGAMPQAFFEAVGLGFLYLDHNQFTSLPVDTELGEPGGAPTHDIVLNEVWLQANALQGDVPPMFGKDWTQLTELLLHENPLLTGLIDPLGCEEDPDPMIESTIWWPNLVQMLAPCNVACECCNTTRC